MKRNTKYVLNLYLCQKFIMRKVILIVFLGMGFSNFAQKEPNRFEESERAANTVHPNESENAVAKNGGNPAVSVPVDEYVPLLMILALALIYYKTYKKSPA